MKMRFALGTGLTLAMCGAAWAQVTVAKIADEFGTIQPAGPRAATGGNRWWNIQGSNNGGNASTGTLRFYLDDVKAKFNLAYPGGWTVTNVRIVFEHDDSSFTAAGPVDVYLVGNDTIAFTNGANDGTSLPPGQFLGLGVSPLRYSAGAVPLQTISTSSSDPNVIFGTYVKVDRFNFSAEGDGDIDVLGIPSQPLDVAGAQTGLPSYSITLPGTVGDTTALMNSELATAGSNLVIAPIAEDIQTTNRLSLLLVPASSTVSATYKGNPFSGLYPPRIYITAGPAGPITGACCWGEDCDILTQAECGDVPFGQWLGANTTCDACPPPSGACCYVDDCETLSEDECNGAGGIWLGINTSCDNCPPPTGACCITGQPCQIVTEGACQTLGGNWLGVSTQCDACPLPPCPGDATGDRVVDDADFSILLAFWGIGNNPAQGDFNGDLTVDDADFSILLANWGNCPN